MAESAGIPISADTDRLSRHRPTVCHFLLPHM